jgi:pyrrolidone-carboxylate peptidase
LIILIGFGPFGKYSTNISSKIVNKLPFEIDGFQFIKQIIPVSWSKSKKIYTQLISKLNFNPELVIILGIHTKKEIHLEKCGWNFKFGDDIDNKIKFGPIRMCSTPLLKSIMNLQDIYCNLEDRSNISISYFPGFYLCNYLYYWALFLSKKEYPILFIHIPYKGNESKCVQKIEKIIRSIIKVQLKKGLYI